MFRKDRKPAFEKIYSEKYWGAENLSGSGSSIAATELARNVILKIIHEYDIKSIVDVACGDFVWMPLVLNQTENKISYTGCDIVESLISSHQKNIPSIVSRF